MQSKIQQKLRKQPYKRDLVNSGEYKSDRCIINTDWSVGKSIEESFKKRLDIWINYSVNIIEYWEKGWNVEKGMLPLDSSESYEIPEWKLAK